MARKILFRADGDSSIGLGHIYRCCAIAQIFNSQFNCVLITKTLQEVLRNEMSLHFSNIIELNENINEEFWINQLKGNEIVVLDGYKFDDSIQLPLKIRGARLICIDDIYKYHFYADAIINHAGGLDPIVYDCEQYTKLYLGPAFAMVRSEFWNKPPVKNRNADNVFVCLGGADPKNDLVKLMQTVLLKNLDLTYHIVTGSAYQHENELQSIIHSGSHIYHYKQLNAKEIMDLMQQCAIAISSPSTVSYEYLSVGGELYLYPIADNQLNIYKYLIDCSLALPFANFRDNDKQKLKNIQLNQEKIFDGYSYLRIKEAITNG